MSITLLIHALFLVLLLSTNIDPKWNLKPIISETVPEGCEVTPLTLNTKIDEPEESGFQSIDKFNLDAKLFRIQALNIADKALKLVVTSCQVKDAEIGEYTHRECFTGLALNRTEDCSGFLKKEGKAVVIQNIVTTLAEAALIVATGQQLIESAKTVGPATLEEVKGNRMKLLSANKAIKNVDQTVKDLTNSLDALKSAIKYAEGSKDALEKWDLQ